MPQDPQTEQNPLEQKKEVTPEPLATPEKAPEISEQSLEKEIGQHENVADLKTAIESVQLPDATESNAKTTSQNMQAMTDDEKVADLLKQAKAKGVVFAIGVAKKLNNPYVLDKLHDALVENGTYKEFLK